MLFNVEKVIRYLGYITYVLLWSPVIVMVMLLGPIGLIGMSIARGCGWRIGWNEAKERFRKSFDHDARFLKTGHWE